MLIYYYYLVALPCVTTEWSIVKWCSVRAPTRAKKVRDSSSFKPNILLGHLSFELEMVEHKFDGNKMELEDSVGAMEDIN